MLQINELELNERFFAVKKFGVTFNGDRRQYQGIVKSNSRFLICIYEKVSPRTFQEIMSLPDGKPDEVDSSFFDRKWIVSDDKDKLIKKWRDNMLMTIDNISEEAKKLDELSDWLNKSVLITDSYEKSPEKWI